MFTLPDLPYSYNALEPFIDKETMHIHHDKHHAAYVKNLNDLLAGHDDLLNMDVNELLKNLGKVPEEIRQKVKNNAGGVANHSLFWTLMCHPDQSAHPTSGKLLEAINSTFNDINTFQEKFSAAALNRFGSGWAWLVVDNGKLAIIDTLNQDSPVTEGKTPILCLDVWEHAYYLKYKNVRADYIKAWWNVVNWKEVNELYDGIR
jgi:Fe-Mn family superoxide dismutase